MSRRSVEATLFVEAVMRSIVFSLLLLTFTAPAFGSPLKDGSYSGTLRFQSSSPANCPSNICSRSLPFSFSLKKAGKRFRLRRTNVNVLLSKGSNGVFSGYAGSQRTGSCVLDLFPGVKAIPDKGMILAAVVFVFRCQEGSLTALYSGRVRKR